MSYTPTNWNTGDKITATAMNKIENGIANAGGSSWDAVIRLTHAENSGPDTPVNLTPSIISGTFAQLYGKILNNGCPCILVEYQHPMWGIIFAVPMAYITGGGEDNLLIVIEGYSFIEETFKNYGTLVWTSSDTISWNV